MLAGLRTLIQTGTGRFDTGIDLLRHDALGAEPASIREDGRVIPGKVSVEKDAPLRSRAADAARAGSVQEWEIAQILAIVLDQIEGVEDRGSSGLSPGQLLEPR
jgi:hypothetical protein